MSYRCGICNKAVPDGVQRLAYSIRRTSAQGHGKAAGSIEREVYTCKVCHHVLTHAPRMTGMSDEQWVSLNIQDARERRLGLEGTPILTPADMSGFRAKGKTISGRPSGAADSKPSPVELLREYDHIVRQSLSRTVDQPNVTDPLNNSLKEALESGLAGNWLPREPPDANPCSDVIPCDNCGAPVQDGQVTADATLCVPCCRRAAQSN